MSWSHIANRGTAQNKTSGTTLTITPSGTIAVGRFLVLWIAHDNEPTGPSPQVFNSATFDLEHLKVTDSQGNVYTQLFAAGEATAGQPVGALFISKIRTQLTTSDTVTITHWAAITAKCASMHEFSSTLSGFARFDQGGIDWDIWSAASGDVPDLTPGSMTNQAYLILHVLAVEGPNTDAYTWDTDYTQITGTGTTGGADDTNMHIRGGWRIATLTSDTIGITSTTADRDLVHGCVSLSEVNKPSTFPRYALLDDANRSNENPLTDAGWWEISAAGGALGTVPGGIVNANLKVDNNMIKVDHTHIDSYGKAYWRDDIPCDIAEVWATLAANPTASIENQTVPNPPTNPGVRGIGVGLGPPDFVTVAVAVHLKRMGKFQVDDLMWFHQPGSGVRTITYIGAMAAGMRIGLEMEQSRYWHVWFDQNGGNGWEYLMSHDYGPPGDPTGLTITHPWRPILWVSGTEAAADNFGGGHRCFPGDIMRRVR